MNSPMKISFVVPTKNSERTLESCLASLKAQTYEDVEVVVVDNRSTDGTLDIASRLADVVETFGPERSAQRNRGTALSSGDVVVFVDSDMTFEPGVARDLVDVLAVRPEIGAVIIPERSFGEGFFARCRVLEKSLYVGDDSVEAARAFRREEIERLGGWDERLTAAEDWDLADRTRSAWIGVARVESYIWHDEGHIRLAATFAKKRYYGRWIAEYLRTHEGAGQRKLARTALFSKPGELVRNPVVSGGMFLLKGVEGAGLVAGMRDERKRLAHQGVAA
jgi:glycosyltransferase involved in cell wall biosynthesis